MRGIPRCGLSRAKKQWQPEVYPPFKQSYLTASHRSINSDNSQVHRSSTQANDESPIDQNHLFNPGFNHEPNVDLNSLKRTLEAHRTANRARLIRKRDQNGRWMPIAIPSALQVDRVQAEPQKYHAPSRRLKIKRTTKTFTSSPRDPIGQDRPLIKEWQRTSYNADKWHHPWLGISPTIRTETNSRSAIERLTDEITAFDTYLTPSKEEQTAASHAINDIKQAILATNSNFASHLIGSRATNLAGPLSDIDFNIERSPGEANDKDKKQNDSGILSLVFKDLKRLGRGRGSRVFKDVRIIGYLRKARVPIIKGIHNPTGIEFQLQSTRSAYASVESSKYFMNEFPTLRSLFKVIKQMLTIRGLCTGNLGGITSYPLLNMIVASLKLNQHKYHRLDVGGHFLAFLDMYATIDFHNTSISIVPLQLHFDGNFAQTASKREISEEVLRHSTPSTLEADDDLEFGVANPNSQSWRRKNVHHPYLMRLQDPADPQNNLGRSAFLIKDLQATMVTAAHKVKEAMNQWEGKLATDDSYSQDSTPILAHCLGADYRVFHARRFDLRKAVARRENLENS